MFTNLEEDIILDIPMLIIYYICRYMFINTLDCHQIIQFYVIRVHNKSLLIQKRVIHVRIFL